MKSHRPPLGQHFLQDPKAIKSILAAAKLEPTDVALEIGPGKGALTEGISRRVRRLVAVELDAALIDNLIRRFAHKPSLEMVHADFLKVNLEALFGGEDRPIKILGNLPYSITSPIFEKLMAWTGWDLGVFLIQKEVAERIASRPGSRAFGILSLAIQLFAEVETILQVKPGSFVPPPRVSSAVIRLRRKKTPAIPPEGLADFFDLVHGAFAHRRKTIANSLSFHTGIERSRIEKWLLRYEISPAVRAETIGIDDYAKLAVVWSIFRRETHLT